MRRLIRRILAMFGLSVQVTYRKKEIPIIQQALKKITVGNYTLWANDQHDLDKYLSWEPSYSSNLGRIGSCVAQYYPTCSLIDVGANIGDSIAILRNHQVTNKIVAVEGEPYYFELLKRNSLLFTNVDCFNTYLSDKSGIEQHHVVTEYGTSRISSSGESKIEYQTLDELLDHDSCQYKLIKLDTDGYDFKILRGATKLIHTHKPVIFCEYDAVHMRNTDEDGLSNLQWLSTLGYDTIAYFDNLGRIIISTRLNEVAHLLQLQNYISGYKGRIQFYDICVFHAEDSSLANEFITKELEFTKLARTENQ